MCHDIRKHVNILSHSLFVMWVVSVEFGYHSFHEEGLVIDSPHQSECSTEKLKANIFAYLTCRLWSGVWASSEQLMKTAATFWLGSRSTKTPSTATTTFVVVVPPASIGTTSSNMKRHVRWDFRRRRWGNRRR